MRTFDGVINAGLPRSGTSSFQNAVRMIGLRSLHIWESYDSELTQGDPSGWSKNTTGAERWSRTIAARTVKTSMTLMRYDALSDTPFYLSRAELASAYPLAHSVCTLRDAESWADSMIRSSGTGRCAGGQYLAKRYGLSCPHQNNRASRSALIKAHARHHATECQGVPALNVSKPAAEVWRVLCRALPRRATAARNRCMDKVRADVAWPHAHKCAHTFFCRSTTPTTQKPRDSQNAVSLPSLLPRSKMTRRLV